MINKYTSKLYYVKTFKFGEMKRGYFKTGDGTLFSRSGRKTKLLEADVPEWFLYGRFYKRWGYISTKGVVDLVYVPNMCFNHFLRDDFLLISYNEKIVYDESVDAWSRLDYYKGYDLIIDGDTMLDFLRGVKKYSNYDISEFIPKIQAKAEWLREKFPEDYSSEVGDFMVEDYLARPFDNRHPSPYYKGKLTTETGERWYFDTKFSITECEKLSEITPARRIDEEWREFFNVKIDYVAQDGRIYHVFAEEVTCQMVLLNENGIFLRCIKPFIKNLTYTTNTDGKTVCIDKDYMFKSSVLNHFDSPNDNYFHSVLYLPEKVFDTAMGALTETDVDIYCICRELFDT